MNLDNHNPAALMAKVHFEPTVTLGHMISVIIFSLGGLAAWYNLKEEVRVSKVETQIRWENQVDSMNQIQMKNKEQDLAIRELGVELKSEIRSNNLEIKQELRDLRSDLKKKP